MTWPNESWLYAMRNWLAVLIMIATKSSPQELFVFSDLALAQGPAALRPVCDDLTRWSEYVPLSPAIRRGGHMTFVLGVVESAAKPFVLQMGQYPPNALALKMYRLFPETDSAPEPVLVPTDFRGRVGESQRCALFLLEVEVPADLLPGRLKLEPALWVPDSPSKDYWVRYPMEVRITAQAPLAILACPHAGTRLEHLLQRSFAGWLDECPQASELPNSVGKVLQKRRAEGKNQ